VGKLTNRNCTVRQRCRDPISWLVLLATLSLFPVYAQTLTESHLPLFIIDTDGQAIPDEPKIMAHLGVIDNGPGAINHVNDPYNGYDGWIGIEKRGSSSQYYYPKKQYAMETREADGSNRNVSLLGMPEENDWILHAPYSDKTLIRNALTYTLARKMGWYATRVRFCEVILNEEYMGVYILMEKIKRDGDRVDIARLDPDETSGDDLTGGYILKVDKWDGSNNEGWQSEPPGYAPFRYQYHYPDPEDIVPEQREYIQDWIGNFESILLTDSYTDPQVGYPSLMNLPSVIDHAIIQEISGNVDAYRLSLFMYKDKDSNDPRLTMGPIWDFNIAWGNCDFYGGGWIQGWRYTFDVEWDQWQIPFWWVRIWEDPAFQSAFTQRYFSLRESLLSETSLQGLRDSLISEIGEDARIRNFQRWPMLDEYVWPNNFIGYTYEAEVGYLAAWTTGRLEWLDEQMVGVDFPTRPERFHVGQPFPNPFNASVTISYHLKQAGYAEVTVFNVQGQTISRLRSGYQRPGFHETQWLPQSVPSGLYLIRVQTGREHATRKVVLLP